MTAHTHRLTGLILALVLLTASVAGASAQDNNKLNVVATTTQAADLMTILAGDAVNLTALMGAGVDPHLYQPTESDIAAMNQANVVIYSGLHLEGQFDTVFEALGERNVLIYRLSRPIEDAGYVLEATGMANFAPGAPDPHFWFDPRNWELTTMGLAETLAEVDPDNAERYMTNAQAYARELHTLYDWGVDAMALVPESQRALVSSHDAFQYFGDAFAWDVRGLQGISTQDEAGVADIQDIADYVVEREIPVMFVESSVPPNAIEAVQEAVKSRGFDVGIGVRVLFSDAMGEPGTFGGTYIGMIGTNVITILQSFGVDIPVWSAELKAQPPAELFEMES